MKRTRKKINKINADLSVINKNLIYLSAQTITTSHLDEFQNDIAYKVLLGLIYGAFGFGFLYWQISAQGDSIYSKIEKKDDNLYKNIERKFGNFDKNIERKLEILDGKSEHSDKNIYGKFENLDKTIERKFENLNKNIERKFDTSDWNFKSLVKKLIENLNH
ncbi:unnamed protein product [Blepharisma stoltei]|uniref:Uncharacterized protein n=1 Tax=Blepharisma stoltei TaxID=1481888 RepID=A0AAU9JWD5_9CILI|nr:unnamed protein product [Blepharisma stoltei]